MKRQTIALCFVASVAAVGLGFATVPSGARAAAPTATPYPSASASASHMPGLPTATPSASATGAPPPIASSGPLPASTFGLPRFSDPPLPDAASEPPTADEWKAAPFVEITRRSPDARPCSVRRIREYLRVRCEVQSAGARVLAGDAKKVEVHLLPPADPHPGNPPGGVEVTFPLRRKDPHLIQLFEVDSGYEGGFFATTGRLIDVSWPDSAPSPTVIIR